MDLSLLRDRKGFLNHVIDALAKGPLDYLAQMELIQKQRNSPESCAGGGILLPVYFREDRDRGEKETGQYVFCLSKRSKDVQQAGDLCAPGGGIHWFWDSITEKLIKFGLLPGFRGPGLNLAKRRGGPTYEKILFFFGNALRESWEELRLSPFNVEFLGPLPTYSLQSRRWIIFPLVGRVKHAWEAKLSWEVERIVSIPLEAFFQPANYAVYSLEVPEELIAQGIPNPWEFPCLVHEEGGKEEILWGATYKVIQTFFQIVFDFSFPPPEARRVIHKPLAATYFSGRFRA